MNWIDDYIISKDGVDALHRKLPSGERIVDAVMNTTGIWYEELTGRGRRAMTVTARRAIIALCRHCTLLSYPQIARLLGRRTHSSVVESHQRTIKICRDDTEQDHDVLRRVINRAARDLDRCGYYVKGITQETPDETQHMDQAVPSPERAGRAVGRDAQARPADGGPVLRVRRPDGTSRVYQAGAH